MKYKNIGLLAVLLLIGILLFSPGSFNSKRENSPENNIETAPEEDLEDLREIMDQQAVDYPDTFFIHPGGIILMHNSIQNRVTVEALPELINLLKNEGYEFYTINELIP